MNRASYAFVVTIVVHTIHSQSQAWDPENWDSEQLETVQYILYLSRQTSPTTAAVVCKDSVS